MEDMTKQLKKSTRELARARKKADDIWETHVEAVQDAHRGGMSCAAIGKLTGVSKARIWQIVKREDTRKEDATGNLGERNTSETHG